MSRYSLLSSIPVVFLFAHCFAKLHNYDNFDMEALLLNSTRSKAFFECVGDESKCTNKEDKEMKDVGPIDKGFVFEDKHLAFFCSEIVYDMFEMVTTSCVKCTVTEKKKYGEAMKALRRSMGESQIITMFINKMTNMFQGGLSNTEKST